MFDGTAPIPLDYRLLDDAYHHLVRTLCLTLPRPPGGSEQDLARRDHAAIARISALAPANAAEADLAAQFVAASEQWKEGLRLAQLPEAAPERAAQCRAWADRMMRQANSALRLLLRLQELRQKTEADNAASNRVAWIEHGATRMMAAALAQQPAPAISGEHLSAAPPAGLPSAPAAPEPEPAVRSPLAPEAGEAARDGEDCGDIVAEAEYYAVLYPERAALIRRSGGLPGNISFGPPDADLVHALVTARTPALAALDAAEARTA